MFPVKYHHPLISLNKLYKGCWFVFTNEISFVGGLVLTINKSVEITFFKYAHGQEIGKTNNLKDSVSKYTKGLNRMAKLG